MLFVYRKVSSLKICIILRRSISVWNFICIFAVVSALCGYDVLWGGRSRWVEHYILKGVTDALFLDPSKLPHSNSRARTNARVTPRGVVYTLRSVLRGLIMSSLAHFTDVLYILLRGCFSVCYFCKAVVGRDGCDRQMWTPTLFVCSHQLRTINLTLGCLSEQKEKNKAIKSNWQTIIRDSFHFWWHRTGKLKQRRSRKR